LPNVCVVKAAFYIVFTDALSKVEETADHINRLITEAEDGEKLVVLARRLGSSGSQYVIPGRKILKQGLVYKVKLYRCQEFGNILQFLV